MVRYLTLAAAVASALAACGTVNPSPAAHDGASAQATSACNEGCQPGTMQIRMNMTAGEMVSHRW
jgi:hypothetical protein